MKKTKTELCNCGKEAGFHEFSLHEKKPTHTQTDQTMLAIAVHDTLAEAGYEETTLDMVFRAVNEYEDTRS